MYPGHDAEPASSSLLQEEAIKVTICLQCQVNLKSGMLPLTGMARIGGGWLNPLDRLS